MKVQIRDQRGNLLMTGCYDNWDDFFRWMLNDSNQGWLGNGARLPDPLERVVISNVEE